MGVQAFEGGSLDVGAVFLANAFWHWISPISKPYGLFTMPCRSQEQGIWVKVLGLFLKVVPEKTRGQLGRQPGRPPAQSHSDPGPSIASSYCNARKRL